MMEILFLFAVMGYATAAGAAHHLHASEFDSTHPAHRRLPEEQAKRAAIVILWPIALPIMLGVLLCRRLVTKVRAKAVEQERISSTGGIILGSEIQVPDDETYRRLTIAIQRYEKEKGYDG